MTLGATVLVATTGSTMAGLDRGELPVAGFTHTSRVDHIVERIGGISHQLYVPYR